jgi:hypothetical protein
LKFKLLFLLLLCFSLTLEAQRTKSWLFRGIIIDCTSGQSVAFADIYNESSRFGLFTDSTGNFVIPVNIGDTLVIQSMWYFPVVFFVESHASHLKDTIKLCQDVYNIGELQLSMPGNYEDFKRSFLKIIPEKAFKIEGLPEPKIQDIPILYDTNFLNSDAFAITSPVSYLYYKYSKEEKSKRKVFYLERQKRELLVIDKKFNRELIESTTGLTGDSITEFIGFCNFSHKFLYHASELEIVQSIDSKYKEFLSGKRDPNP